jgi:N-acyl-D-aspartate/D-glutamate deacylase
LIRRTRHWITQVVALALLTAQFGMAAHASTHLGNLDQDAGLAQICDYCLTASALQSMADDAAAGPVIVHVAQQCPPKPVVKKKAPKRAFTGFRSRAPPTLL